MKFLPFTKIAALCLSFAFGGQAKSTLATAVPLSLEIPSQIGQQADLPQLIGLGIDPNDFLRFTFLTSPGDHASVTETEVMALIKQFFVSLTVPESDFWVNLSPHEPDRIMPEVLRKTQVGEYLIQQDYTLKQLTATLLSPEHPIGQQFWDHIHNELQQQFGHTNIPIETFNKIWIIPESAELGFQENTVFITDSQLTVLTEQDYLSTQQTTHKTQQLAGLTNTAMIDIVLPAIKEEVNHGASFAPLRQVYQAMILASWYKQTLKDSLLGQAFANQGHTDSIQSAQHNVVDQVYNEYVDTFRRGVFDLIQEEYDVMSQEVVNRKYYSGGIQTHNIPITISLQSKDQWTPNPTYSTNISFQPTTFGKRPRLSPKDFPPITDQKTLIETRMSTIEELIQKLIDAGDPNKEFTYTAQLGDQHGYRLSLSEVLDWARQAAQTGKKFQFVGQGDYFDRGINNTKVLDILIELVQLSRNNDNIDVRLLMGNHEQYLIEAMLFDKHLLPKILQTYIHSDTLNMDGFNDIVNIIENQIDPLDKFLKTVINTSYWFVGGGNITIAELGPQRIYELLFFIFDNMILSTTNDWNFLSVHAGIDWQWDNDNPKSGQILAPDTKGKNYPVNLRPYLEYLNSEWLDITNTIKHNKNLIYRDLFFKIAQKLTDLPPNFNKNQTSFSITLNKQPDIVEIPLAIFSDELLSQVQNQSFSNQEKLEASAVFKNFVEAIKPLHIEMNAITKDLSSDIQSFFKKAKPFLKSDNKTLFMGLNHSEKSPQIIPDNLNDEETHLRQRQLIAEREFTAERIDTIDPKFFDEILLSFTGYIGMIVGHARHGEKYKVQPLNILEYIFGIDMSQGDGSDLDGYLIMSRDGISFKRTQNNTTTLIISQADMIKRLQKSLDFLSEMLSEMTNESHDEPSANNFRDILNSVNQGRNNLGGIHLDQKFLNLDSSPSIQYNNPMPSWIAPITSFNLQIQYHHRLP